MMGLTVVGKPAATVITSSPGRTRRSFSCGEVSALKATRLADEPGIDQQGRIAIHALGQLALELLGEPAGGEPEIEAGLDGQLQFLGIEHAAGVADRGLAGHERPRGKSRLVVLRDQVSDLAAKFF